MRLLISWVGAASVLFLLGMNPERAAADGHQVRIDELLSGANGDSRIQFVELSIAPESHPLWAPQPGEASSRARLLFYDATGTEVEGFGFSVDPPLGLPDPEHGAHSILVASQAFVDLTGVAADYIFGAPLPAQDGMVCFAWDDSQVAIRHCVAFGNYQGASESDGCTPSSFNGPPAPALPIAGESVESLQRYRDNGADDAFGCGHDNADFRLESPSPRNSAGAIGEIRAASLAEQGRILFEEETFAGNGRTCATCHREVDGFGLAPRTIAEVFHDDPLDPLFVAENVPGLAELENTCLLRGGNERGLSLVHVRGFDRGPSFRSTPHLLNVELTAPYGWSHSAETLSEFSLTAILQHFPRTLARNSDPAAGPIDLRVPTNFELDAMDSFMESIRFPRDGNLDLDRMIDLAVRMGLDPEAIQRGRDLFNGDVGQAHCSACHSGPALSQADGTLQTGTGNEVFDIGVAFRMENEDDGCAGGPGDRDISFPSEFRRFATPPLLGVAQTAPYFHDNSAADLRAAVDHYALDFFLSTEAGNIMEQNGLRTDLSEEEIDDIVIFLEAISVDPTGVPLTCGDGFLDSTEECDDGGLMEGDGCSMACLVEDGFECDSEPSVCGLTCSPRALACDLNADGAVDRRDTRLISEAEGTVTVDRCDPRDINKDGLVSSQDTQACAAQCDRFLCQEKACGLLGLEVAPLLVFAMLRRRRNRLPN